MAFDWHSIKNLIAGLKDLTAIGAANGIAALISGLFWFYMASLLGTELYGKVSYLIAIAATASTLSLFGAQNTVIVYTAKEQKIQTSIYLLVIILSIVTSLIVFFIVHDVGVTLFVFGVATFSLVLSEQLGKKLYKNYFKYVISQRILLVGSAVGLYNLIGWDGIILGFALSYFPYIVKLFKGFKESKIDVGIIKLRLGFMTNSFTLDVTGVLIQSVDKIIIYPMFGFALLGNYQLGMQFLLVLLILPGSVYQFILPRDATGISSKKLVNGTILLSIVVSVLAILLIPKILPIFFPKFKEAIEIIQIMSLGIVPLSISMVYNSKFFATERSRIVLIGSVLFFVVQTLAIFILGKTFGINGAATGPVFGAVTQTAYLFYASRQEQKKLGELL